MSSSLPNISLAGSEETDTPLHRSPAAAVQIEHADGKAETGLVRRDSFCSSLHAGGASSLTGFAGVPLHIGPLFTPAQLRRNLAVLSAASALTLGPLWALQASQSSLPDHVAATGVTAFTVLYAAASVSSAVGPAVVQLLSPAWTLLAGCLLAFVGLAAHLTPTPFTLVPTALALGLGLGPWQSARTTLLVTFASKYAFVTETVREKVLHRFVHVCQVSVHLGHVAFSLGLAMLLAGAASHFPSPQSVHLVSSCRPTDCRPQSALGLSWPLDGVPWPVAAGASASALLAAAFLLLGLDRVELHVHQDPLERPTAVVLLRNVMLALADRKLLLCLPLALCTGLEQGFLAADFTKSYVSCALGLPSVGWALLFSGVTHVIGTLLVPILSQHVQRVLIIGASVVFHLGLLAVLWLWRPQPDDEAVFYVVAAGWGLCHSVWENLAFAMITTLYSDLWQAPCALYTTAQYAGLALAFGAHNHICNRIKILILATCLPVAALLYAVIELRVQRYRKMRETTALL